MLGDRRRTWTPPKLPGPPGTPGPTPAATLWPTVGATRDQKERQRSKMGWPITEKFSLVHANQFPNDWVLQFRFSLHSHHIVQKCIGNKGLQTVKSQQTTLKKQSWHYYCCVSSLRILHYSTQNLSGEWNLQPDLNHITFPRKSSTQDQNKKPKCFHWLYIT